ncbi:recombinase family protein, partial [[Clostridium] innocuum]|nr:recombinase family protein [[Clostridium] innocuum]
MSAKPLILLAFCRYRYHTSLFDRPSFQRMIEDIEAGKINCVVTKDLSRLGRNYIMTGQYTEL